MAYIRAFQYIKFVKNIETEISLIYNSKKINW